MNNVLLSIKTDAQTKEGIKARAKELGISSTAFVNMVVRQNLRKSEITLTLEPTSYLKGLVKEADKDYKNGDYTTVKSQEDLDKFFDSL